jgi:Domain of unknown function (DUF4440)
MHPRYPLLSALLLVLAASSSAAAQDAAPFAPIVAQERAVLDAVVKPDTAAFNRALGSDFVYVDGRGATRWERAKTSALLLECKSSPWSMESPVTTRVGNDLVVLTYTASFDETCSGQKLPSPVHAMSVWQNRGGKWVAVAHSETPVAPKQ